MSGVVPLAGHGTVYDEGAFSPSPVFAPFGGDPFVATGLSAGPGTVVPFGSTNTSWAIIPSLAVDYYINKNFSIEAICCVSPHHIQGTGTIQSTFAHTWVFPPTILLDYHFTNFGAWQPYIGVGVNFTAYWGTRVNNESWPVMFSPAGPLTACSTGARHRPASSRSIIPRRSPRRGASPARSASTTCSTSIGASTSTSNTS